MWAYLTRRNRLLAAVTALVLCYFSVVAFWIYLALLLVMVAIFHLGSANSVTKVSNFIANTATLVFTLAILAVLLEIGLHLKPGFFLANEEPNVLGKFSDFTDRGYLTEEVFNKHPGVFRILALGDSFSVNLADQKKNYLDFLQGQVQRLGRGRIEVINAGMPGIGPGYYWHILENYGDRFQPDLVLVGFFMNDFCRWELLDWIGIFISEPHSLKGKIWDYRSFQNSRLFKLLRTKYIWYREQRQKARETQARGKDDGYFSQESFLRIAKIRSTIFQTDKASRSLLARDWRESAGLITKMKGWCDARKVPMVLLVLPDQFQVDAKLRAEVQKKYHLGPESFDLEFPNSLISGYCRQLGLRCLDLLPAFQEQGRAATLYALRDTHWNEAGNRLAAEVVFNYLQEQNLLRIDQAGRAAGSGGTQAGPASPPGDNRPPG